ncbi:cytochrome bc1 complex cytochrome b subunit [Actinopolymorpha singaporensis]|uniref:Cytochrome bc1 complex cytochrome b subunit n=1 Tax=Actinopolymorpha singaporensis TaxID=117157 RepID=A0A1H1V0Y0_9ACTN|nr:cytochrome b N-terminal domain-containing protein [Actinopolymorpha singaporensis]SDS78026.1 ubiquinol-cytochrome c reductase cytochrome b subunit [Actinopolymorpha singaporensis]
MRRLRRAWDLPHTGRFAARLRTRAFPDDLSVLLAQIGAFSFVLVAISGVVLMFFYDPSMEKVTYAGSYTPLAGVEMSRAFASTLDISVGVRGGLLMRQVHHWSSLVMTAAIMVYLLRLFFTGAFRRPRRWTWLIAVASLLLAMAGGLTGSALPDDLLSGSSMAVLDGVLAGTPFVGGLLSRLVFGGPAPGDVTAVFYPVHVVLLPAALVITYVVHAILGLRRKPAQYAGRERPGTNLATFLVRSAGLFLLVSGVVAAMAATLTVNPVWRYGPADPASATAGSTPTWYLAFLDGALRLAPGWEFSWLGRTWSVAILLPLLVGTLFFAVLAAYPYLDQLVTRDRAEHHLLQRPRNHPVRTGVGVAGIVFYGVLWAAAGVNAIALVFHGSVEWLMYSLQVLLVLGPVVGFDVTRRICLGLQRNDREVLLHGRETGRIVRTPSGGYVEIHVPVQQIRADERRPAAITPSEDRELSQFP